MSDTQTVRVGTRATALAKAQTEEVLAVWREKFPDRTFEVVEYTTAGDAAPDQPVAEIGEAGVFVNTIERALLAGEIDVAVHSAKDLPTKLAEGLEIGAFPPRGSAEDALIAKGDAKSLADLPDGTKVGTSSPRRHAMLKEANRSFEIVPVRGSVETRLGLLDSGEVDALVLAVAGLKRLGLEGRISAVLDEEEFMPAPGQGALAVEVRAGEHADLCEAVNDPDTQCEVECERHFLAHVGGGCTAPVGARAWIREREQIVKGMVGFLSGDPIYRSGRTGPKKMFKLNAKMLASSMDAMGGKGAIETWLAQRDEYFGDGAGEA